jgi:hypothetical protein
MESFLINNSAIIGCWDPDSRSAFPSLVREQVFTSGEKQSRGRMDIVGIAKDDDGEYELRIFELKNGKIDSTAVSQLSSYLKTWEHKEGPKAKIKEWIITLGLQGMDEAIADRIIDQPVGVLVGSKFSAEAIKQALELDIKGIRLARFKGAAKSEYYVIIEDEVGEIVSSIKKLWSWNQLINAGLIQASDNFYISFEKYKLIAKPDPKYFNYKKMRLIFEEPSKKALLEKEEEIKIKSKDDTYAKKWLDKAISSIKKGEGVWLSNATGLCYFAFGGPAASYWTPSGYWIHEKSGKRLDQLKNELLNEYV